MIGRTTNFGSVYILWRRAFLSQDHEADCLFLPSVLLWPSFLFFCSIDASHLHSKIQAKTNLLFEAHQAHRLSLLGPAPSPTTSSPDEIARYAADKEQVLAEFYRDWIHANRDRQARWVWEWWADVREDVGSGLRKGLKRLFG